MNKTNFVLCDYDRDENIYSLYDFETEDLVECFKVNEYDYSELKNKIKDSSIIAEKVKEELFKDWTYATETKLERNGCYFFKA